MKIIFILFLPVLSMFYYLITTMLKMKCFRFHFSFFVDSAKSRHGDKK